MADTNPYAPPQSKVDLSTVVGGVWREGRSVVIVDRGADLPARCIRCNAPAAEPIRLRRFYWHHPAWYLLLILFPVLNILVFFLYALVALFVRKRIDVSPGQCARHRLRRRVRLGVAWSLFLAGIGMIWFSLASVDSRDSGIGIALLIGAILIAAVRPRLIYAVGIGEDFARLKGFGRAFLDGLPVRG